MSESRICPQCGFRKFFEPGDSHVCNYCANLMTPPEPMVPYPFGEVSAPARTRNPSFCDGADAIDQLDRDALLELARARGELFDVEIRHLDEGP